MSTSLTELRREVRTLCQRWQDAGNYQPRPDAWLRSFNLPFSKQLAERGWLGMTWPSSVGGAEESNLARLVVTEELLRAGAPVAAHWIGDRQIGPSILRHGSPELQQELLPGIAAGQFVFCLGMSEPDAGSDLAAVRTTATRVPGGWSLRGRKIWTSHAHRATHAYVLARTEQSEDKHSGLTEFVIDINATGVSVSPIIDMGGSHHFNEVLFEDVFVPEDRVIGTIGAGWQQVTEQLAYERGGPERVLSTYPVLQQLLESAGPELSTDIGELVARLAALRALCVQVAEALDAGQAPVRAAATLKYLGTAFERDVLECARRTTGSGLIAPDSKLGEAILASPGFSIRGGSSEVLLSVLAKHEARHPGTRTSLTSKVAADVLSAAGPPGENGALHPVWPTLVDLGWPQVGVDERSGGVGGTVADLVELVAATAEHGVSVPLLEMAVSHGILADQAKPLVITSDTLDAVPWARHAERVLVVPEDSTAYLVEINASGVEIEYGYNLAGEPRDTLRLTGAATTPLPAAPGHSSVLARAALLKAAALVGAARGALERTREHVTQREQFGRPLLALKAVANHLAEMSAHLVSSEAALARAVQIHQHCPERALAATAVAKISAARTATAVARTAHQLHGAIGVTREHSLHQLTRKLWAWRDEYGSEHAWSTWLGRTALEVGEPGTWADLTGHP